MSMNLRCSIDRGKLASALSSLCHFIRHDDDKTVLAECIHVVAKDGRLRLSAACVDMSGTTTMNATIDEEGECMVPAVPFRDAVAGCQGARVTIAHVVEGAEHSLLVTGDFARVRLVTPEPKDTPDVPDIDPSMLRPVEDGFRDLLKSTVYAASTDEERVHLCGVFLAARGRSFVAAATDGHRLATMTMLASLFAEEWSIVLPSAACKALLRLPGDVTGVGLGPHRRFVATVGGMTMTSRPVEGEFPPYEQVIPSGPCNRLIVDRADLQGVSKAAAKIVPSDAAVVLTATSDRLRLTFSDPLLGDGSWDLPVRLAEEVTPLPWSVAISPKYLGQCLVAMTAERVTLSLGGELDPVKVIDGSGRVAVVMPRREPDKVAEATKAG